MNYMNLKIPLNSKKVVTEEKENLEVFPNFRRYTHKARKAKQYSTA